jgi:hypothetical protein
VDPVQLAVRLLVPRGSSLVGSPALDGRLGPFDPATFSYVWQHPDPRVDALQRQVAAVVEQQARAPAADAVNTFYVIKDLALAALGRPANSSRVRLPVEAVPRLSEPWFC